MPDQKDILKIIKNRRNPRIAEKLDIWNLEELSYVGGAAYLKADNLFQYVRESKRKYDSRKKRAVYFNHVQPLADILIGFIYSKKPDRENTDSVQFFLDKATRHKDFNSFIESIATRSLLYTVGILIDSPQFNQEEVKTKADEERLGLKPYCVMYYPWQIIDFYMDDKGELEWVLLDNSYVDNSNPYSEPIKVKTFRLWERNQFTDFYFNESKDGGSVEGPNPHPVGEVPFVFSNSRDIDDDYIIESPFEDITLTDRLIYNLMSLLDEQITAASFKPLFLPCQDPKDIPAELKQKGIQALDVIPYVPVNGGLPKFDGPDIANVSYMISVLELYIKSILQKVGLDNQDEKTWVQSGIAKKIEFQKTESLLRIFATQLENTEAHIFQLVQKWIKADTKNEVIVKYNKEFQTEDLEKQLARLWELFATEYESVKQAVIKEIVKKVLPDLEDAQLKELYKNIDDTIKKAAKTKVVDVKELINQEKENRINQTQGVPGNGSQPVQAQQA